MASIRVWRADGEDTPKTQAPRPVKINRVPFPPRPKPDGALQPTASHNASPSRGSAPERRIVRVHSKEKARGQFVYADFQRDEDRPEVTIPEGWRFVKDAHGAFARRVMRAGPYWVEYVRYTGGATGSVGIFAPQEIIDRERRRSEAERKLSSDPTPERAGVVSSESD